MSFSVNLHVHFEISHLFKISIEFDFKIHVQFAIRLKFIQIISNFQLREAINGIMELSGFILKFNILLPCTNIAWLEKLIFHQNRIELDFCFDIINE